MYKRQVEILSENRKNASFAVNGAWGVGKTFVLNRFEEEIAKYKYVLYIDKSTYFGMYEVRTFAK